MKAINPLCQPGLDYFCENPGWKAEYESAPFNVKRQLELGYQDSASIEFPDFFEPTDEMFEEVIKDYTSEDWKWEIEHFKGNYYRNKAISYYKSKYEEALEKERMSKR